VKPYFGAKILPMFNNDSFNNRFTPSPAPIAEGPRQYQEVMEQPVSPIGSHSHFAPQNATIQEEQKGDIALSWQVGEHDHALWTE